MIDLDEVFDELFPICRSITGPAIRESLRILGRCMPLEMRGIASGTQVFDWTVPPEWELHSATLHGPNGDCLLDTRHNNLHVVNFSEPFQGTVSLQQLQNHLYSIPEQPDLIPYVTSYYQPRWGLCLSERQRQSLRPGNYNVNIQTSKRSGELNYSTCELRGDSDEVILISSYLCHPSMANNELSGPLAMVKIYDALSRMANRRFTYKFVLAPETIGSLSFISHEGEQIKDKIVGGMVLTCLGGPAMPLSIKTSRRDWVGRPAPFDRLARHLAEYDANDFIVRSFSPCGGSDERQYCSPGVDWPMVQVARTVYGDYREYHTSGDDKQFMTVEAVEDSARKIIEFLRIFDLHDVPLICTHGGGEPQLGRPGLYPTVNGPMSKALSSDTVQDSRYVLDLMLQILSLSDGHMTILDMSRHIRASLLDLVPIANHLLQQNAITSVHTLR